MSSADFNQNAWLRRIGYTGPRTSTLTVLRDVIAAHTTTIPFENLDVLLGRVPKLDLGSLQAKLIDRRRGGYCFEQNTLFQAGLRSLGFTVSSLIARVIRGMAEDAVRPETHMILRVDLPEGPFLADVGFGVQTPTAPMPFRANVPQDTPHETMRLFPVGEELVLQARLGDAWKNIYRLSPRHRLPVDFEVANWFVATHSGSPFISNMIATRPGAHGARNTLFNGRFNIRRKSGEVEKTMVDGAESLRSVLAETFGVELDGTDLDDAIDAVDRAGNRGVVHPLFV